LAFAAIFKKSVEQIASTAQVLLPAVWVQHTLNHFTALFLGLPGGELVPEEIFFWTFMVQGKTTEADTPTIRLGATPLQ